MYPVFFIEQAQLVMGKFVCYCLGTFGHYQVFTVGHSQHCVWSLLSHPDVVWVYKKAGAVQAGQFNHPGQANLFKVLYLLWHLFKGEASCIWGITWF
jgi:hypothetical protein